MGIYSNYPIGAVLYHSRATPSLESLKGASFLIIEAGWGTDYYPEFAERLNLADSLKIPAFLLVKMDAEPYQNMGYDPAKWPSADRDIHMKTLDRAIYMGGLYGGTKRKIAGILWDLTYYKDLDGEKFTETWMAGLAKHLSVMSYKRHGIPFWYLCTQSVLNAYGNNSAGPLATLFTNQPMSCIKMAFSSDPTPIGVSDMSLVARPPDTEKPDYLYGNPFLWIYAREKFLLQGVATPVAMYWGSKEKLYAELNFNQTSPENPEDPENPGGNEPPILITSPLEKFIEKLDRSIKQFCIEYLKEE